MFSMFYMPFPSLRLLKALGVRCLTSGGVGRNQITDRAETSLCTQSSLSLCGNSISVLLKLDWS